MTSVNSDTTPWLMTDGWLSGARRLPSANCNSRPSQVAIELIVIHNISLPPGEFGAGNIEAFFTNSLDETTDPYFKTIIDLRVSAHFLIDRAGAITQFVSCQDRAWHAGVSSWCGRHNCNDFSVGIELEGTDDMPYTSPQYEILVKLIRFLRFEFPTISANAIVGHSDIAPERKTDPGHAFDWHRLYRELDGGGLGN